MYVFLGASSMPYYQNLGGYPNSGFNPPPFNFQGPPPGYLGPPPGYLGPPPGFITQAPIQAPVPVVVDQQEIVMHAKMQLYSKDLLLVKDITELIEYCKSYKEYYKEKYCIIKF